MTAVQTMPVAKTPTLLEVISSEPVTDRERIVWPTVIRLKLDVSKDAGIIGGLRHHNRVLENRVNDLRAEIELLKIAAPEVDRHAGTVKILRAGNEELALEVSRLEEENRKLRNAEPMRRYFGTGRKPKAAHVGTLRVRPTLECMFGMARV